MARSCFRSGIVALVFTLIMLQWSYDRFRLHSAPFLDDVNWLNEGIAMLTATRDGGISGLPRHVIETRTLAPYSIVAAAGFALFGIVDWAPYLMNGCLIFSLLFFLEIVRRREGLPLRTWILGAALALAFPISGYSIVSFLGDNASGLFIAIGSIAFLEGWPASKSRIESWTGTLAWVFAFYGKATLFPETMLLFAATALLGYFIARRASPRAWVVRVAAVLLLILPYYGLVARNLYDYMHLQNFGALREVWAFKGTRWESLLYYVTGFSGQTMLGPALFLAVALMLLRAAFLVRESLEEKLRFAAMIAVIAIAYILPTWTVNKTLTVGSPFQFLIVLITVICLYRILKHTPRFGVALEVLVAVAVLFVFRFPEALDRRDAPAVLARHRTLDGLISALQAQGARRNEPVFLTSTGYISGNTLQFECMKRALPVPHFFEFALSGDASEFPPLINQAAFVIATDEGNDEVFYTAPSAFIQAQTLAMVQQNPAFTEVTRFSTWRGKHYYLFGRRERVKSAMPSTTAVADLPPPGPVWISGVSSAGPDQYRWSSREFEIEFPAPRGLYAELKVRLFVPQTSLDKLGPMTLRADIPREGSHTVTFSTEGVHDFTFQYAIKQHLVSTVRVRFRLDKALRDEHSRNELGLLVGSAELVGEARGF